MQIHEIEGASMRAALERAKAEVGAEALVLGHGAAPGGGILLAVARAAPADAAELERLRAEAQRVVKPAAATAPVRPGTGDVERCLRATGCSSLLVDRVCEAVAGRLTEGLHPIDLAAEEIGLIFRRARSVRVAGTTSVIALLGPTGVGKTTSAAKLAARLVRGGRRIALATVDTHRVGAVEQLRAYADLLRVPLFTLRDAAHLSAEVERTPGLQAVLLDTSGHLKRDVDHVCRLRDTLGSSAQLSTYVVTSAVSSRLARESATHAARAVEPSGCIVTKLDETEVPGPVMEHALREKLAVGFVCDGPDLAHHMHRATGELFADLLLRGRVA